MLPRDEKVSLLAYEEWKHRQRKQLRTMLSKDDWGVGIEALLLALAEL